MKLIIAGSRDLELTLEAFDDIIYNCGIDISAITEVVSGGAAGIDTIGEHWAECRPDPLDITVFQADWDTHGVAAGPIRNKEMAKYADAALVIMKKGGSKGSKNMIDHMHRMKKPVTVIEL